MNYLLHLLIYFDIYAILALSLNLVVGYCGLLTFAHAGYYAIGGYVASLLMIVSGWGFMQALLAGSLLTAVASLTLSLTAWRLRGDLFVIASLAMQSLIFSLLNNWFSFDSPLGSWNNMTNGPDGLSGIPVPTIFEWEINSRFSFAILATVLAFICGFVINQLTSSPWGRLLLSMRDDELATRALGKNTRIAKVQAFAIASIFAAISGTLYSSYVRYIDPTSASLSENILVLSMVIVGGLGNFRGPLIGAAVLVGFPELLRFLELPDDQAANIRLLMYGFLLVLLMHLRPQGIAGDYRIK